MEYGLNLSNYSLILKISFIICTAWSYISGSGINTAFLLSTLLFMTALSFLMPAYKKPGIRLSLISLSIIIICVFFNMFPLLLVLVPILAFDLLSIINVNPVVSCPLFFLGIPLTLGHEIESLYFLSAVFSVILVLLSRKEKNIKILRDNNIELRLRTKNLLQRIQYNEGLRNQLTYTAQLEERNRIAQELHDKVGHSLSGSLMQLEAVKLLAANDPQRTSAILQTVIDTLRNGLDNIRVTLRNTKPPAEQMGINRLQLILDEFMEKNSVKTFFIHEGDLSRVTPVLWKIFIENTTEALTNFLRHSKGDRIRVSLNVMNRIIRFQIKDNGNARGPVKKGLGLAGIEERLLMVDGRLILDNSDGFSITMLVPDGGDRIADKNITC